MLDSFDLRMLMPSSPQMQSAGEALSADTKGKLVELIARQCPGSGADPGGGGNGTISVAGLMYNTGIFRYYTCIFRYYTGGKNTVVFLYFSKYALN